MRNRIERPRNRSRQAGYNLVEVLIAMALLGTVLMSIVTLFFMGRANVYSGKQMTQAVAVGTTVMEDLATMTMDDFVTFFGLGTAALGTVEVAGSSYAASTSVKTKPISAAPAQGTAYLTKWSNMLTQERFTDGTLTIVATPVLPGGTATWSNAPLLRLRVVIEWKESTRPRHIEFETVKTNRTRY